MLTTIAQLRGARRQTVKSSKTTQTPLTAGFYWSQWHIANAGGGGAGSLTIGNTTTGVLFDNTTTGAIALGPFSGGGAQANISHARFTSYGGVSSGLSTSHQIYDRLWGAGAISVASTGTTTFSSQPSYAARVPAEEGYQCIGAFVEIVTGTSGSFSVSIGYANEDGTSGRTSPTQTCTASSAAGRLTALPLQAGDRGVSRIDSITVVSTLAGTTVNIVALRRVCDIGGLERIGKTGQGTVQSFGWGDLGAPVIFSSSCLMVGTAPTFSSVQPLATILTIVEG